MIDSKDAFTERFVPGTDKRLDTTLLRVVLRPIQLKWSFGVEKAISSSV